jgi:hypothetical protein
MSDVFGQLADLLAAAKAPLSIAPKVSTRSTIYDLDYRVAIVACAMQQLSTSDLLGHRKIIANWLKLAQFTAMRPALLSHVLEWIEDRKSTTLVSERWRRGFVGDGVHDAVIEFLAAQGIVRRQEDLLLSGERYAVLADIETTVRANKAFINEREVLTRFSTLRPIKAMLSGS